ncbi:MAG TPA: DUF5606 domain-containing protein [Chitinophagaceae bacterium]|jgi:hypothetical protein
MEYRKIVSVTGLPGLYELISSKTDGAIVRSLEDQSTRFASGRVHNFSHLESIEVYTTGNNVNLAEVFQAMEKAGGNLPDTRDNTDVRKYFDKVYPEMDFERVYNSDLKKMVKWFDVLSKSGVEIKLSEPEAEQEEQAGTEAEPADEREEPKAKKAGSTKKEPAKKPKKQDDEKPEEQSKKTPAKKAAKKSK